MNMQVEEICRQGMWEGTWRFHVLLGSTADPEPPGVHQPRSSLNSKL